MQNRIEQDSNEEKSNPVNDDSFHNIIGKRRLIIDKENWALSLVRQDGDDHSFIVLEGVDAHGRLVLNEAHLALKAIAVAHDGRVKRDKTQVQFDYVSTTEDKLKEFGKNCISETWKITKMEKNIIEMRIRAYQNLRMVKYRNDERQSYNYNLLGAPTLFGGSVGGSLDASGSNSIKEQSIKSGEKSTESGAVSLGKSSLSVLREGHNCLSWAEELVRCVRPDFNKNSVVAKFVVVPRIELPSSGCCIL